MAICNNYENQYKTNISLLLVEKQPNFNNVSRKQNKFDKQFYMIRMCYLA